MCRLAWRCSRSKCSPLESSGSEVTANDGQLGSRTPDRNFAALQFFPSEPNGHHLERDAGEPTSEQDKIGGGPL